jgi:hypothetical protein
MYAGSCRARTFLFAPTDDPVLAAEYPTVLRAQAQNPAAEQAIFNAQAAVFTLVYLHHAHQWAAFMAPFIAAGGLSALAPFVAHANVQLRAQALEICLCATTHPEYDWLQPAASNEDRRLHAAMLQLGQRGPFLQALADGWIAGFPGESFTCLQLLAWWLSWARRLYTKPSAAGTARHAIDAAGTLGERESGVLFLGRALLQRLRAWTRRRLATPGEATFIEPPAASAKGTSSAAGAAATRPALRGDEEDAAFIASLPPVPREEHELAVQLYEDFSRFPAAEDAADLTRGAGGGGRPEAGAGVGGEANASGAQSAAGGATTVPLNAAPVEPHPTVLSGLDIPAAIAAAGADADAAVRERDAMPSTHNNTSATSAMSEGDISASRAAGATLPPRSAGKAADARASAGGNPVETARAEAQRHKDAGNKAFVRGDWAAAVVSYTAGISATPPLFAALAGRPIAGVTTRLTPASAAELSSAAQRLMADLHSNRAAAVLQCLGFDGDGVPPAAVLIACRATEQAVRGESPAALDAEAASAAAGPLVLQRCPCSKSSGAAAGGSTAAFVTVTSLAAAATAKQATAGGTASLPRERAETAVISTVHTDSALQACALQLVRGVTARGAAAFGTVASAAPAAAVAARQCPSCCGSLPPHAAFNAAVSHLLLGVAQDCDVALLAQPQHLKAMYRRCQALCGLRKYGAALAGARACALLTSQLSARAATSSAHASDRRSDGSGGKGARDSASGESALDPSAAAALQAKLSAFGVAVSALQQADSNVAVPTAATLAGAAAAAGDGVTPAAAELADASSAAGADSTAALTSGHRSAAATTAPSRAESEGPPEYSAPAVTRSSGSAAAEDSILAALLGRSEYGAAAGKRESEAGDGVLSTGAVAGGPASAAIAAAAGDDAFRPKLLPPSEGGFSPALEPKSLPQPSATRNIDSGSATGGTSVERTGSVAPLARTAATAATGHAVAAVPAAAPAVPAPPAAAASRVSAASDTTADAASTTAAAASALHAATAAAAARADRSDALLAAALSGGLRSKAGGSGNTIGGAAGPGRSGAGTGAGGKGVAGSGKQQLPAYLRGVLDRDGK